MALSVEQQDVIRKAIVGTVHQPQLAHHKEREVDGQTFGAAVRAKHVTPSLL
jgi:hypothetical protein